MLCSGCTALQVHADWPATQQLHGQGAGAARLSSLLGLLLLLLLEQQLLVLLVLLQLLELRWRVARLCRLRARL